MSDMNNAFDNFKQMLSSPEGQQSISTMLGSLTDGQNNVPPSDPVETPASSSFSPDMMMKMTQVFGTLQNRSGPHFDLLFALRPYLSAKKQGRFEMALRMLQLSKLPQI